MGTGLTQLRLAPGLYLELSRLRRDFFDRINKIKMIFLFSLYPEHPWPRPDLQGLSSMVTASEVFQPQHNVPCNSRQGRPVYPV